MCCLCVACWTTLIGCIALTHVFCILYCDFLELFFFVALRAEGDILTVVTRDEPDAPDGWVKCLFRGNEGVVPDNYVEKHNI